MSSMRSPERNPQNENSVFYEHRPTPLVETHYKLRLIAGNANPVLAEEVASQLQIELTRAAVKRFANGEISIKIEENVRGDDVFVVQPTCGSANQDINTALMELMLLIHTLRLSSAKRITAVIPYFAYSRQDRKTQPRVPISASAVAQLIQAMGVDRVVTLDLHCGQIQGFFRNIPLDNLLMFREFAKYITSKDEFNAQRTVVVSPDAGGVERATVMADAIGAHHVVTILKRRVEAGKVDSMQTVGDVNGYTCVVVDDMVDTAGTLVKACELLQTMGASRVIACATHGILTDPACERISKSTALQELVVSDSIPNNETRERCGKVTVLTTAPLLAKAIENLHNEESVSGLFKHR